MRAFIATNLYGAKTQWATAMIDSTRTLLVGTRFVQRIEPMGINIDPPKDIRFLQAPISSRINRLEAAHGEVLERTEMRQ